jgi:hypothetical protein
MISLRMPQRSLKTEAVTPFQTIFCPQLKAAEYFTRKSRDPNRIGSFESIFWVAERKKILK